MQNTDTFRTLSRGAIQFVMIAVVAAAGVSVGRWVIPASDSTGATAVSYIDTTAPAAALDIIERKFAQMDAEDARHSEPVAGDDSIIERKFAQMDARDARHSEPVAGPVTASSTAGDDSIIERKFAQMDAEDARYTASSIAGDDSIIDRKFAQMDAEDAR